MDARTTLRGPNFSAVSFTPPGSALLWVLFPTVVDQRESLSPICWNLRLDTATGSVSILPVLLVPSTDGKRKRYRQQRQEKSRGTHLGAHRCNEYRRLQWQMLGGRLPTKEALDLHPSCLEMRGVDPCCSSRLMPQSDWKNTVPTLIRTSLTLEKGGRICWEVGWSSSDMGGGVPGEICC